MRNNQKKLSIAQIKLLLKQAANQEAQQGLLKEFKSDKRVGVQKLLQAYNKRLTKQRNILADFSHRLQFEKQAWHAGECFVAGVDEVGRGPLAGPVVAAAVILPHDFKIYQANDSKQLSAKKREQLFPLIMEQAVAVGIGSANNHIIDRINIFEATKFAMKEALCQLSLKPDRLLVDAMQIDTAIPQIKLIKGDARSVSIGAASIVAKVYRDHMMADYAQTYPGYGFAKNVGYGTKEHLKGIENYGVTPIHRVSFEPIKSKVKH